MTWSPVSTETRDSAAGTPDSAVEEATAAGAAATDAGAAGACAADAGAAGAAGVGAADAGAASMLRAAATVIMASNASRDGGRMLNDTPLPRQTDTGRVYGDGTIPVSALRAEGTRQRANWKFVDTAQPSLPSSSVTFHHTPILSPVG